MIITLKGANFANSNIGTLDSYSIRFVGSGVTNSNTSVDRESNTGYTTTITLGTGYELNGSITVTMGGTDITSTAVSGLTITIPTKVTGNVVITVPTKNTTGGEEGGGDVVEPGTPSAPVTDEFVLTSSMLTNNTYSTAKGDWNESKVHLSTDFLELNPGYDIVFDLPDDWNGYVAHIQRVGGEYVPTKTVLLSGWVTKATVSTGPYFDRYFIVLQKKDKTVITPSDYDSIAGSVQIKKPDTRTVTVDSSLLNVGKGYSGLNIISMPTRLATWYYALTPGSTVTGSVAEGLKAYIVSIRAGESVFTVDTDWVTNFNKTYDTACSIMIVAKKDDGSEFADASAWTSPVTIDIK